VRWGRFNRLIGENGSQKSTTNSKILSFTGTARRRKVFANRTKKKKERKKLPVSAAGARPS